MNIDKYKMYCNILQEELLPALGCTEPIALAYAAAKARETLDTIPSRVNIFCSGNIIKNVKSVIVPNTGGLRGIEASVLAGIIGGSSQDGMEVLSHMGKQHIAKVAELLQRNICEVTALNSDKALHFIVDVSNGNNSVRVEVQDYHTNITLIEKNGHTIYKKTLQTDGCIGLTDRSVLNVDEIVLFAETVDIDCIKSLIYRQIEYNIAIAKEGLKGSYGLSIGRTLLNMGPDSVYNKMKAYTASASEARMGGCERPVVTNSGSGNQGIACSVPVIIYARELGIDEEKLLRALVLSNLLTIHQKTPIGRLSAFCGVVSASCASGAAITWLAGGSLEQIKMAVTNTLANVSGIVCDGAKPSCGIKTAASLDAAIMGHLLAMDKKAYSAGDGLVKSSVEETILSVGRMAHDGMKETDKEILRIMMEC